MARSRSTFLEPPSPFVAPPRNTGFDCPAEGSDSVRSAQFAAINRDLITSRPSDLRRFLIATRVGGARPVNSFNEQRRASLGLSTNEITRRDRIYGRFEIPAKISPDRANEYRYSLRSNMGWQFVFPDSASSTFLCGLLRESRFFHLRFTESRLYQSRALLVPERTSARRCLRSEKPAIYAG